MESDWTMGASEETLLLRPGNYKSNWRWVSLALYTTCLYLPPINSQRWGKLEESESWLSCNLSQPSPPFVSVIPTSRMLNIIPYIPQLPITILYKSRGGWIFWGWTRLLRREHTVYQSTQKIWGRKRIFHTGTEKSKHIKGWSELHYRVGSGEWGWSLS